MSETAVAVISDAHLGNHDSWLHEPAVQDRVVSMLAEPSAAETLVLLGDTLDLNYGRLRDGVDGYSKEGKRYPGLRQLLASICDGTQVQRVIYVPGNHDFMLWEWEARKRNALDKLAAGLPLTGPLKIADEWDDHFLGGLMPPTRRSSFRLKYPCHTAEIGDRKVALTHGHYLDCFQSGRTDLRGLADADDPDEFMQDLYKACAQWQEVAHANAIRRSTREGVHRWLGGIGSALDRFRSAFGQKPMTADLQRANVFLHCVAKEHAASAFVCGHTHVPGRWQTARDEGRGWGATWVFNCGAFTPVHKRDATLLLLRAEGNKLKVALRSINQAGADTTRAEECWEVA